MMEWLYAMLKDGKEIEWNWFIAEGSYKFDILEKTIKGGYLTKYFKAPSAPFELYVNHEKSDGTYIRFKESWEKKNSLTLKDNIKKLKQYVKDNKGLTS